MARTTCNCSQCTTRTNRQFWDIVEGTFSPEEYNHISDDIVEEFSPEVIEAFIAGDSE